jgi:hypothetical protein
MMIARVKAPMFILLIMLAAGCGNGGNGNGDTAAVLAELGAELAPRLEEGADFDGFDPAYYRERLRRLDAGEELGTARINLRNTVDALAAYQIGELPGDLIAARDHFAEYETALAAYRDGGGDE